MIGKLLKNEFKAGLHSVAVIYLVALAAVAVTAVSALSKSEVMTALSLLAVMAVGFLLLVITIVSVVNNFNKTLYRDQGYLTFTLPVTSGQILFAKSFCSFFWITLSLVTCLGLLYAAMLFAMHAIGEDVISMIKIVISQFAQLPNQGAIASMIIFFIINFFLSIVYLVSEIFLALTVSNTRPFQKHSMLYAIVIFSGILIVTTAVSNVLKMLVPLTAIFTLEGVKITTEVSMMNGGLTFGIADLVFQVAATCGFFYLTSWFMNNKINLK